MIEPKSTDIGRRVSFMVGEKKELAAIADFNSSYVHVVLKDRSTIPLPRDILDWAQDEGEARQEIEVDDAARAAITVLKAQGVPYTILDQRRLKVGDLEVMPCTRSWTEPGGRVRYGGIADAIAAARVAASAAELAP